MYALLLCALLQGPSVPPICEQEYRLVVEEIVCPGVIESEKRIWITMPDGRRIHVPVLNGWLPQVNETNCSDGSVVRKLSYQRKILYTGDNTNYVTGDYTAKKVPQPKPVRKERAPVPGVDDGPPTMRVPQITKPSLPPPDKLPTPKMRKLSEVKDDPKITVVPRYHED